MIQVVPHQGQPPRCSWAAQPLPCGCCGWQSKSRGCRRDHQQNHLCTTEVGGGRGEAKPSGELAWYCHGIKTATEHLGQPCKRDFCRKPKRPLQISAPVEQGGLGVHPFLGPKPQDTKETAMGEHWPPAQTGHNLYPVPGASCSLQPGWPSSEAAATWDRTQLFGGTLLPEAFPQPQGLQGLCSVVLDQALTSWHPPCPHPQTLWC